MATTLRRAEPPSVLPGVLRIGVIGYGYWGPNLARNFHQLPEASLVACADADPARLGEAARLYPQLQTTTDYRALLDHATLDAVAIATPARTHYDLARAALERGKHVLVEKPLAMTSVQARDLAACARTY